MRAVQLLLLLLVARLRAFSGPQRGFSRPEWAISARKSRIWGAIPRDFVPREASGVVDAIEAALSGNDTLALRIFQSAVQLPFTSVKDCNKFIRMLGDCGDVSSARAAYESMLTGYVRPDMVTLSTLMSRAAKVDLGLAIEFFDEFSRLGIDPDVVAYNTLVHALAKTGNMTGAFATLDRMKQQGVHPNIVTYNSLIGGSAKLNKGHRIRELLRTMQHQGMRANSRTYNSIIAAYSKQGDLDTTLEYLAAMKANEVPADLFTYGNVIDCAVKAQDFKTAYRLLRELKEDGLTPNVVVWTTLIDGCGKAGRLDAARALFKQMIATGTRPNVVTCSALIDAAWKHGKNDMAVEMLEFMKREGLTPNEFIWTSLFVNSACTGDLRALSVVADDEWIGILNTAPNMTALDGVPAGISDKSVPAKIGRRARRRWHQDNLYKVFLVFRQMQYEGIDADICAYNGVLSACANAGEPARAVELFGEMMERGLQPDSISYTMLIKAYHIAGDADGAENVFEEMQSPTHHFKEFCRPTEAAYAHLLGALLQNGRHERIFELYQRMRYLSGLLPSFQSMKYTLAACQKEDWRSRAIEVFADAQKHGLSMQDHVLEREAQNDSIIWARNLLLAAKAKRQGKPRRKP